MAFKVYEEKEEKKKDVFLKLKRHSDGDILLLAVDEDGDEFSDGSLLLIKKDGRISVIPYVNKDLGFKLDEDGRVVIE